ncbi:MAG TPA: phage capsid protein [Rummeliibacillus sp.]|nr:phage capsid protein [Rummeliibacillus sp.]
MADQIDLATASQLFDTEVTIKYQNSQYLADTIEERHGTTGEATNVPVSDIIEMQSQTYAPVDIPITPVNPTNVMIIPYNYALKTVIGGGEKTLFAYDKIVDHAKLHALAAARMVDYIKINALFTSTGFGTIFSVDSTVGVNTGMNEGKMAQALSYLENQGVNVMNNSCSLWLPAITKQSMLNDDRVVSIFYNDVRPLVDNRLSSYLGVDIRTLGANGINTIPFTSSLGTDTYLTPLVHEDSMVQIFNRDVSTSITWVPQNDRWELLTVLTSGANVVQYNGIALIETANPYVANA